MAEEDGVAILFSAARMAEIEAASIVDGEVDIDGDLQLRRFDGTWINAGHVVGASGSDAYSVLKQDVRIATTTNVNLSAPGTTIGGATMASGDRFLAAGQTTASQNGIYVFNGSAVAATRATDANTAATLYGAVVWSYDGPENYRTQWKCVTRPITLGTTSITWFKIGSDTPTAYTFIQRSGGGTAQVEAPSTAKDIVNKTYADALGAEAATVSTIVRRNSSGIIAIAAGTASGHGVNKGQMDTADSAVASAAAAALAAKFADTGWIALPFNSGYQNFGASYPCQYRIITVNGISRVRFRGLIERAAGNMAAGTAYTPVFTMPSGARPSQTSFFPLGTSTSTTGGMVTINTVGVAEIRVHTVALTWASIDGIEYTLD